MACRATAQMPAAILADLRERSAEIVVMKDGLDEHPTYDHAVTIQLKQRKRDVVRAELPPLTVVPGGKA